MTTSPLFKRVPVEATPEMLGAWYRYKSGFHFPDEPPPADTSDVGAYRAMLAASPEPPAEEGETLRAALTDALAFMKDVREQRGDSGVGILIRNAEAALGARAKGHG